MDEESIKRIAKEYEDAKLSLECLGMQNAAATPETRILRQVAYIKARSRLDKAWRERDVLIKELSK